MGGQVAARFGYRAFEEGLPAVLWVVQLDPRGASDVVHRCKQARGDPTEGEKGGRLGACSAGARAARPAVGVGLSGGAAGAGQLRL